MAHIKRGDLANATCSIPSVNDLISYDKIILPFMKKYEYNSKDINNLEKLRDTLLPKLISSEVRVSY